MSCISFYFALVSALFTRQAPASFSQNPDHSAPVPGLWFLGKRTTNVPPADMASHFCLTRRLPSLSRIPTRETGTKLTPNKQTGSYVQRKPGRKWPASPLAMAPPFTMLQAVLKERAGCGRWWWNTNAGSGVWTNQGELSYNPLDQLFGRTLCSSFLGLVLKSVTAAVRCFIPMGECS